MGLNETAVMIPNGVKCSTHVLNVSDRERVRKFADDTAHARVRATHLINNAGVGLIGSFEQISLDDMEWLMNINYRGIVYGVKFFLPTLTAGNGAHRQFIQCFRFYRAAETIVRGVKKENPQGKSAHSRRQRRASD